MLRKALSDNVKDTFNMVSVDGDTSTNDMVSIMANGRADDRPLTAKTRITPCSAPRSTR